MSKKTVGKMLGGLAVAICAFSVAAQNSSSYNLEWNTIGGGGGPISGGAYTISGTVGQPDAGSLSGGNYAIEGGFWPGADNNSFRIQYARQGSSLNISWHGIGFMLQSADTVAGRWQDVSSGTTSDGVGFQVTVPMTSATRFYRLHR
jgi:hypothetical protein